MKLKITLMLAVILTALLCGCSSERPDIIVKVIDVGVIIHVSYLPETWDSMPSTHIETDKGLFVVGGNKPFLKGDKAEIRVHRHGKMYFCTETLDKCLKLW